ncbi:MAG: DMT family transporter [Prevotellaceae bacterium]|jgi:drug/metabolite transporter (DMT)-like permease|nr:DMT family transporter [Prevotellaceae bacterium]
MIPNTFYYLCTIFTKIDMQSEKVSYKIYVQIILANVFWGFSFVWTDVILKSGITPITLVLIRMVLATILLGLWAKYTGNIIKIKRKHLKYFLCLAMCEPFLYFLCETYGQTMVSPTVTSVIVATIPLFTPFVGFMILKEKIGWSTVIGIIVSMAGVIAVVFVGSNDFSGQFTGAVLVFGAVIASLGYAILVKYIMNIYNATTLVFYQNLIGLIYFLPCFLIVDASHVGEMQFTFDAVSSLVQISVFASVIAFVFYSNAVKVLGIIKSGVFCYLIPVLTALFAFFVVDEQLKIGQWVGMAAVISGLFISQIKKSR